MNQALTLLLVILLVWHLCFRQKEGFKALNEEKVNKMTETFMKEKNKKLFHPKGLYSDATTRIRWLDPVTYYDLTKLHHNNEYTEKNIRKMFK